MIKIQCEHAQTEKYTMKKESKEIDYSFDLYEFLEDDSVNNDNYNNSDKIEIEESVIFNALNSIDKYESRNILWL